MAETQSKFDRKKTFLGMNRMNKSPDLENEFRRSSYMKSQGKDSQKERKEEIEAELEELRSLIHPNEWNNIPACIRSAVMGLIDFNDTITQKVITEHALLA